MTWRQSTGRESCLICHAVVAEGAALHVGDLTGAKFCEPCAASELGRTPDGPVPRHAPRGTFGGFDAKAMGAKLRAAILEKRGRDRDGRHAATGERE